MGSTRRPRGLEERVRAYLARRSVPPGARVLVAFSGGPDSMALLALLRGHADSYPLTLTAAYLDHGLRSNRERRDDGLFVRASCVELDVPLVEGALARGRLAARARREHRSLEETARQARYRFLRRAQRATGSPYVALGHNLDDQLETLVMRFFQGAGVAGLRGIPARGRGLLRPLLQTSREEIEAWLEGRGLGYRLDSSNRDPAFLRNSIRHRLLPLAAEIFPGYPAALQRFSRTMRGVGSMLARQAQERLPWREESAGWSVGWEEFLEAPFLVRLESLHERINRWGMHRGRIPERFFEPLRRLGGNGGRRILLAGHGMILERRGERLFLERDIVGDGKKGYFIAVGSGFATVVSDAGLYLSVAEVSGTHELAVKRRVGESLPASAAACDAGASAGSLVFRSAQTGDRIQTRGGHKQLRKLFGEWKIPSSERWKVPVVDSRQGILAVLGGPLGYADRFCPGLPDEVRSVLQRAVEVR